MAALKFVVATNTSTTEQQKLESWNFLVIIVALI